MGYKIEGEINEFASFETEDVFRFKFVLLTRAKSFEKNWLSSRLAKVKNIAVLVREVIIKFLVPAHWVQ